MNCYILAFFNRVCYQISMGLFNLSLERVSVKIPWGIKPRYSEQNYLPLKGKETKATLFHLVLFRPLSLSVRMIDLSIGDKKLFSIMRLLPPPSHFPWAIIAGLSERPMITTGLGHKGKSISARGSRWRTVHVCVCVYISVSCLFNSWYVVVCMLPIHKSAQTFPCDKKHKSQRQLHLNKYSIL